MKKVIAFFALLGLTLTSLQATQTKELKLLPIATDATYCANIGVALLGGYGTVEHENGAAMYGLEVSLACPMLQLPTHAIRQQVSLVHYDENGFTMNSLEFNPHLLFDLTDNLQLGAGPGFGVIFADADGGNSTVMLGINAGLSLNYDITPQLFTGVETRWQWTTEGEFVSGSKTSVDNYRSLFKVGMRF